ncbi:TPA: hypothetical protein IUT83_001646 [Enterococcus faecalis]|nr:hypothetical protein [Enterococcus faecalis]
MKGSSVMDWVQLSGILSIIATIVATLIVMVRDNKNLTRDHKDLSKDHVGLKHGQKSLSKKLSVHEKNRVSDVHKLDKTVSEIMKETTRVSTFLFNEKQKEQHKLSLLNYSQQDIQDSLEHIQGIFEVVKETNRLNAKLASEREELIRKNEELTEKNQQLQQKNHELTKKLDKVMNKGRSRGLER